MKTIPIKSRNNIEIYSLNTSSCVKLPLVKNGISAGFPSPAEDFDDTRIDLNKELIRNPSSTFFAKVRGDSMIEAGLHNGDLLIIDKSLDPQNNKIAVCFIDGEFTVKRIEIEKNVVWLNPANKKYSPLKVTSENNFLIWGIVTHVIKSV